MKISTDKAFSFIGDNLYLSQPHLLSFEDWKSIAGAFNKLGYDIKSAKQAEDVYSTLVRRCKDCKMLGYKLQPDQQEAILILLNKKSPKNINLSIVQKDVNMAENYFGITSQFSHAGYLTVNGTMLDFSEGQGYRTMDHRQINSAIELPEEDNSYSGGLLYFMNEGNIRMLCTSSFAGFDIMQPPNEQQKNVLYEYIKQYHGEIYVDYTNRKGNSIGTSNYLKGTSPQRIFSDINKYFAEGFVPVGTADAV